MAAVIANPDRDIRSILRTSAVAKERRKTGRAKLNFTDKNSDTTNKELYIQRLGITALKTKTATDGYKKKRLGKKT